MREPDTIVSQINYLEKSLDELKTAQKIGGDSWIFYRNVISDNTWDIDDTMPANTTRRYRISFVPEDTPTAADLQVYHVVPFGDWGIMPVPNSDADFWLIIVNGTVFQFKFVMYSTQKGTVSYAQQ